MSDVLAIGELVHDYPNPIVTVWHLRAGISAKSADFQPVKCGGGINLPGTPQLVPRELICPDCTIGRKTL